MAQRTGRWGLLRLATHALLGTLHQASDFRVLNTAEVRVETRHRRIAVATDGEVNVMDAPLHYRIHPRALRVIVAAATATD
jgi:diacylglycerol kinase family enzyme